jgi:acetyl-CoA carboxylase carboxyltransferase component
MNLYSWHLIKQDDLGFAAPIKGLLNLPGTKVYAYLPKDWDGKSARRCFDGLWTLKVTHRFGQFAIARNDFKIFGGSYGVDNSKRFVQFLDRLNRESIPLYFSVHSIGVRIMEGRKVFPHAFSIIPALLRFSRNNLLVTNNSGKSLGIGALLYVLGQYRMALKSTSQINLTGPEVFKMFFGEGVDFSEYFNSTRIQDKTSMIHEVVEDDEQLYSRVKQLFGRPYLVSSLCNPRVDTINDESKKILNQVVPERVEVFPQVKGRVKTYIGEHKGLQVGVFINPHGKSNMIDLETIEKYRSGMNLFKQLGLPIISFVDTPGADPRREQTEGNIITELATITADIIDYPYPKIGVPINRCYGGASVLTFPSFFGGERTMLLKGAHFGIMGNNIIRELLSGSASFTKMWEQNLEEEAKGIDSFIELGVAEGEFELPELAKRLQGFIERSHGFDQEIESSKVKYLNEQKQIQ